MIDQEVRDVLAACDYRAVARKTNLGIDLELPGAAGRPPLRRVWRFQENDEGPGVFLFDERSDESYRLGEYALRWALFLLIKSDLKAIGYSSDLLDCQDEKGRQVDMDGLLDFGEMTPPEQGKADRLGDLLLQANASSYDESRSLAEKYGVVDGFELCLTISMEKA